MAGEFNVSLRILTVFLVEVVLDEECMDVDFETALLCPTEAIDKVQKAKVRTIVICFIIIGLINNYNPLGLHLRRLQGNDQWQAEVKENEVTSP